MNRELTLGAAGFDGGEVNLLLNMDASDEVTSMTLGYKDPSATENWPVNPRHHPEIQVRYSNEDLLKIFKTLGNFEHPLSSPETFKLSGIDGERLLIFDDITTSRPDVVLEIVRDDIEQRRRRASSGRHYESQPEQGRFNRVATPTRRHPSTYDRLLEQAHSSYRHY